MNEKKNPLTKSMICFKWETYVDMQNILGTKKINTINGLDSIEFWVNYSNQILI